MTLIEFLLARIAEDEAIAKAAVGKAAFQRQTGHWKFDHVQDKYGVIPLVFALADAGGKTQVARLDEAWDSEERGTYIARFDPARALAECDAKRRLINIHATTNYHGGPDACDMCTEWDDYPYKVQEGIDKFPCDTLRALALPYADHPDYRQEWRP
jgi:hypothetical protein